MSNDCFTITTQEAFCNGITSMKTLKTITHAELNSTTHFWLRNVVSVCLSVTLLNHAYMVQDIETSFAPQDKDTFQLSGDQIF